MLAQIGLRRRIWAADLLGYAGLRGRLLKSGGDERGKLEYLMKFWASAYFLPQPKSGVAATATGGDPDPDPFDSSDRRYILAVCARVILSPGSTA